MWKLIEQINWAERSGERRGYEDGKRYMLETFTTNTCREIRDFVDARFKELYKRIETFEKENDCRCGDYGGDDSFGDMIHHVIGLGENVYNMVMENPKLLDRVKYVESFSYCLPYEEDFKMLDPDHHAERALMCVKELTRILEENHPSGSDVLIIKDIMDRFLLMLAGDFSSACHDFDENTYNLYYKFEANDCHACFSNYIKDCKQYMI